MLETIIITNTLVQRDAIRAALTRTKRLEKTRLSTRAYTVGRDFRSGQRTTCLVIYPAPEGLSTVEQDKYNLEIAIWKHCLPPYGVVIQL